MAKGNRVYMNLTVVQIKRVLCLAFILGIERCGEKFQFMYYSVSGGLRMLLAEIADCQNRNIVFILLCNNSAMGVQDP